MKKKSLWVQVIEIALSLKIRSKKFVPARGYSTVEIIKYLLNEFNDELTIEEKEKLKTIEGIIETETAIR